MNENRVRFVLSGLSDPHSNKVVSIANDSFVAVEKNPVKWGEEYLRFLMLLNDANTFNEKDIAFWWDVELNPLPYHEKNIPNTDVEPMAYRLIRILCAERCVRVYRYERNNVVRYCKTPEFKKLLSQIIRIEERLLDYQV